MYKCYSIPDNAFLLIEYILHAFYVKWKIPVSTNLIDSYII